MEQQSTERLIESRPNPSRVVWEQLEAFARQGVRELLQQVLEEEVDVLLRRGRYERRQGIDAAGGYRNGFGKPRRLSLSVGTVTVRRPRVRGLAERFESRILPLFKRRTPAVSELPPTLYLHGLAEGDFDLALRGLLGDGAPLSAASIARLKAGWQAEYDLWKTRTSGVHRGLGGAAARSSASGLARPSVGDRRRPSGHLGGSGGGVPHGRRAAVLESPDPERARQAPAAAAARGQEPAGADPDRGDAGRGRAGEARVPDVVHEEGRARRWYSRQPTQRGHGR